MKTNFSRTEVTNVLLSSGYRPTIMKDVSEFFDVYLKEGKPRVQLPKTMRVFPQSELQVILPKELQ